MAHASPKKSVSLKLPHLLSIMIKIKSQMKIRLKSKSKGKMAILSRKKMLIKFCQIFQCTKRRRALFLKLK